MPHMGMVGILAMSLLYCSMTNKDRIYHLGFCVLEVGHSLAGFSASGSHQAACSSGHWLGPWFHQILLQTPYLLDEFISFQLSMTEGPSFLFAFSWSLSSGPRSHLYFSPPYSRAFEQNTPKSSNVLAVAELKGHIVPCLT